VPYMILNKELVSLIIGYIPCAFVSTMFYMKETGNKCGGSTRWYNEQILPHKWKILKIYDTRTLHIEAGFGKPPQVGRLPRAWGERPGCKPSLLRPSTTVRFAPYTFPFLYIYTLCYVSHYEFLSTTYLNAELKKIDYSSQDLFIDSHHDSFLGVLLLLGT
jgi:hypothetical protein